MYCEVRAVKSVTHLVQQASRLMGPISLLMRNGWLAGLHVQWHFMLFLQMSTGTRY